jgi:hypothetical protein
MVNELYRGEMDPPPILKLLENWDEPLNEYRIGAESLSVSTRHLNQVVLGPTCRTMAEIESLAAKIRADLDRILAEARVKIAADN